MNNFFFNILILSQINYSLGFTSLFGCEGRTTQDTCLKTYYCGWCKQNNTNSCFTIKDCNNSLENIESCIYNHNKRTCNFHKLVVFGFMIICLVGLYLITIKILQTKLNCKLNTSLLMNICIIPGLLLLAINSSWFIFYLFYSIGVCVLIIFSLSLIKYLAEYIIQH